MKGVQCNELLGKLAHKNHAFIFSAERIQKQRGENKCGTMMSSVSSALQLLSGRLFNTDSEHQADEVRRRHYHLLIRTSGG